MQESAAAQQLLGGGWSMADNGWQMTEQLCQSTTSPACLHCWRHCLLLDLLPPLLCVVALVSHSRQALTCAQHLDLAAVHITAVQDIPDALLHPLIQAIGSPAVEEAPVHCGPTPRQPTEGCLGSYQQIRALIFALAPAWIVAHPHLQHHIWSHVCEGAGESAGEAGGGG